MDLSAGRRVLGYNIDSLLGPSASNTGVDDNKTPVTRDRDDFATFTPGNDVC